MVLFSVFVVSLLVGALLLIPLGFRAGDQPADVEIVEIEALAARHAIRVTVTNPGPAPVVLGFSLRRRGIRLRLEDGTYVRIRTRGTSSDLLPANQTVMGAVAAGETATFDVPVLTPLGRTAEMVAVIGQQERLRTIHRLVHLPPLGLAPHPGRPPSQTLRARRGRLSAPGR